MKMKTYLVSWYDYSRMEYTEIKAANADEARKIAFMKMCDVAGDHIYNTNIYEKLNGIECEGECNPKGVFSSLAIRDILGNKKK